MTFRKLKAFIVKLNLRRTWPLAALGLLIVPIAYVATNPGSSEKAFARMATIGTALADPLSIFASRSPGARSGGTLAQTKLAQTKHPYARKKGLRRAARQPRERVLANVRTRPALAPSAPLFDLPQSAFRTPTDLPPQRLGVGNGGPPLFVPSGAPIGGGDGTPSAVSSVPEPTTWMMMIAGFFSIGAALRRQRRRALRAAQSIPMPTTTVPPR